jgi:lipoprotein-releasing system ATP-binding protein
MTETSSAAASPFSLPMQEPKLRPDTAAGLSSQTQPDQPLTDTQDRLRNDQQDQPPIIDVANLHKSYKTARGELTLFRDLNLRVPPGEMLAIVGQSGAGKSTLLHILGALDAPSAGTVYCASTNVARLTARQAAAFRNREVGYVWQFHYLLPEFTALENVAMPLLARGKEKTAQTSVRSSSSSWKGKALSVAADWLREVGLEDRADHRPGELSGGEQQRVALARALVCNPRLLLADEPTGDLDEATAGRVFELIARLHATHGLTSILVTHNMELASRCDRALRLESGHLTPLAVKPHRESQYFGTPM